MKRRIACSCMAVALTVGLAGCGSGGGPPEGVPKDVGYVPPPMQPKMDPKAAHSMPKAKTAPAPAPTEP